MNEAHVFRHVESDAEIKACFPVIRDLRPALVNADDFAARVARQRQTGYRLLAAWWEQRPVALAGYRVQENLLHNRHLFVDDLVSLASERGQGLGACLLDTIASRARAEGCAKLVLGTGLANTLAHRFYYRHGLLATGLGFSLSLE